MSKLNDNLYTVALVTWIGAVACGVGMIVHDRRQRKKDLENREVVSNDLGLEVIQGTEIKTFGASGALLTKSINPWQQTVEETIVAIGGESLDLGVVKFFLKDEGNWCWAIPLGPKNWAVLTIGNYRLKNDPTVVQHISNILDRHRQVCDLSRDTMRTFAAVIKTDLNFQSEARADLRVATNNNGGGGSSEAMA